MTTSEKVAYLKGLAEGFGIDPAAKGGKLLSTIIDILEDLALDQLDQSDVIADLEDGLDAVSEDLADVEDVLFGDPEDEDEDEVREDDEAEEESEDDAEDDAEDWDGETAFYECECPSCGETVTFDEGVLRQGGIQCPACGAALEFDLEASEETETPLEEDETPPSE